MEEEDELTGKKWPLKSRERCLATFLMLLCYHEVVMYLIVIICCIIDVDFISTGL